MEKSFSDIIKYLSAFAIICGAFGLIIVNLYLQTYSLVDFNVIKPQIIYVGFTFILFLAINFFVFLLFLDLEHPEKNSFWEITLVTLFKAIILGNLLNYLLNLEQVVIILQKVSSLQRFIISGSLASSLVLPIVVLFSHEWIVRDKKNHRKSYFNIIPIIFFGICAILGAIYSYIKIPLSKTFYSFEIYIAFLIYMFLIGRLAVTLDQKKGIDTTPVSSFGKSVSGIKSLDKWFFGIYFVVMMLILITKYTKGVYLYISPYYGGGKPREISLVGGKDTIRGNLIFQNEKYVFLEKDSSLMKIDWNNINSILLISNKKSRIIKGLDKPSIDSLSTLKN